MGIKFSRDPKEYFTEEELKYSICSKLISVFIEKIYVRPYDIIKIHQRIIYKINQKYEERYETIFKQNINHISEYDKKTLRNYYKSFGLHGEHPKIQFNNLDLNDKVLIQLYNKDINKDGFTTYTKINYE